MASNSAHLSPPPTSNDYSSPSPISNFKNPTDLEIVTPSIPPSPLLSQNPDNAFNNPTIQPTFTQIQTHSRTGHSRPKSFPDYKLFHNTRHLLQAFSTVLDTLKPTSYTQAVLNP